ncbi:MAG: metallophosphoesterase family protein [Gammaproteobacteria bacterium]|nr:metallophosphoesterase family protein [Gammaproteobacteria bacterium]
MKTLVFGDVHGNATALQAVLEQEPEFDSVIFLGDAVSPGPQPNETLELLSELDGIFIRGNHEYTMLNPDSVERWPDGFKAFMHWIYDVFDPSGVDFLTDFQEPGLFEVGDHKIVLAHGDESPDVRHVLPDMKAEQFGPFTYGETQAPVLFGHSHIQFRRTIAEQNFINPGSVGQNRCGHVTACYGLLEDHDFTFHHVNYDPTPWLQALDQIPALDAHESFRGWFRQQMITGFAAGENEPWLTYAAQGYR